ncbi:MAG: response regulator [Thermodesulfobacteriota bacterium]|nr:response regulator [Thermodesulfobacteriota bacterium]
MGKARILIVEDEGVVAKDIKNTLENLGYHVPGVASSGEEAIKNAMEMHPDLALMDIVLEGDIDGVEAAEKIRGGFDVPIIYLTACTDVKTLQRAKITEPYGYILKPFEERELHTSIEMALYKHKMEKKIKESEQKYRTLFENCRDAIYITTREGSFVDVNQSLLDLFDYTKAEMTVLKAREIYVNPDDRDRYTREIELNGFIKDLELKLHKKDGTEMDCLLTANLRKAVDGTILGYQGCIRDRTYRKRLEAQLMQAKNLKAIGTLAGGIAHDFNNLLMGIKGYTSLIMLHNDLGGHPCLGHVKGIEDMVKRGIQLTRQLLGFARGGKYEVKATDINELIDKSSEMFGRTRKEITIHKKYQKDISPVEIDRGQIEQVLLNLYVNAWQAMPHGGDIYIETSHCVIDESYVVPFSVTPGNYVKISVTDTGVGMDEDTRKRIFEPFFTTKKMGQGTGLGLASAYGIIQNHGGLLHVYSEPGKGTTFYIYLPASRKEVEAKEKRIHGETLKGAETVLLIDDEDMILDVGRGMLKELGYKVLTEKNGKKAVEVYKRQKDEIGLIILDMIMPDMSGGEVYDKIKEINPEAMVLLSSGYSINGQAKEILERGCDAFIQKPYGLQEISKKIREVLDKK